MSTSLILKVFLAGMGGIASLHPQARDDRVDELPLSPDMQAAVERAHAALRHASLGRIFQAAEGTIAISVDTGAAGIDPLRSIDAADRLAARMRARGVAVSIIRPGAVPIEERSTWILELGVFRSGERFILRLADGAAEVLPVTGLHLPFVEKEWVRGSVSRSAHHPTQFEIQGHGAAIEDARSEARDLAIEQLRIALGDATFPEDFGRSQLGEYELDRFETPASPGAPDLAHCAVLYGLTADQMAELRAEGRSIEQRRFTTMLLRGVACLVLLVACVFGYLRMDLSTRGYLSGLWMFLFALIFAAGVAASLLLS